MGDEADTVEFSLETSSASKLSQHLFHKRFSEDAAATTAFLQAAVQHSTTILPIESSNKNEAFEKSPLLAEAFETSMTNPRMHKVSIQLSAGNGLLATSIKNPQLSLEIKAGAVSHIIIFCKPEDCKMIVQNQTSGKQRVPKAHVVLLKLKETLKFQNKEIDQVCFSLPWNKTDGSKGPKLISSMENDSVENESTKKSDWKQATDDWRHTLTEALKSKKSQTAMVVAQVRPTYSKPFKSHEASSTSTTTGGLPFVPCYHGVQDGVLYPLKAGLLFFKPPKFLPRQMLSSIECGRRGGGGRYIDMIVTLDSGDLVEFSNLLRDEKVAIDDYLYNVLIPAMKKDNKSNLEGFSSDDDDDKKEEQESKTEDESDMDDENFVADDDESSVEDEDTEDDDSDVEWGVQVVEDDFAKELAQKRKESSDTESEDGNSEDDTPQKRVSKRRRP